MFSTNPCKPQKVWAVIAWSEECNFVSRVFKHKCEALQFCKVGDGNPYISSYTIEEVMLY